MLFTTFCLSQRILSLWLPLTLKDRVYRAQWLLFTQNKIVSIIAHDSGLSFDLGNVFIILFLLLRTCSCCWESCSFYAPALRCRACKRRSFAHVQTSIRWYVCPPAPRCRPHVDHAIGRRCACAWFTHADNAYLCNAHPRVRRTKSAKDNIQTPTVYLQPPQRIHHLKKGANFILQKILQIEKGAFDLGSDFSLQP